MSRLVVKRTSVAVVTGEVKGDIGSDSQHVENRAARGLGLLGFISCQDVLIRAACG